MYQYSPSFIHKISASSDAYYILAECMYKIETQQ